MTTRHQHNAKRPVETTVRAVVCADARMAQAEIKPGNGPGGFTG